MDEAVEIIISGTKFQNIQSLLTFFISGINSFFFYIIPILFKKPELNNSSQIYNNEANKNYALEYYCEKNFDDIYEHIDNKNSIHNYSFMYQLFCDKNILTIRILIFLYFFSKGISSIFFGYLTDKLGRIYILFLFSVLSIITFFCLFLSLFSYCFVFIAFILIGACSYLNIFSSLITIEYLNRNKAATISSLNISSGPILAILFVILLKLFNNLHLIYIIFIIFSIIIWYNIKIFFNESLYYLISRNKINEFFNLLENISRLNERNNLYEQINKEKFITDKIKPFTYTANIIDIFNYKSQYLRLISHTLLWIFSSFSFHGIFKILSFFSPVENFILLYIIFFSTCIITQFIIGIISDIYGRRPSLTYSFYLSSISFLIFTLTEEKLIIKKIFFYICIISSSSLFSLLFIFSSEDFPTCIRGTVLGFLFGISQIIAFIVYFINNSLVLCLVISLTNCIAGRLVESMEDTFELLLDDTLPEMHKNDNLKKKRYRALKCERISTGSDLYFLSSDDDNFNLEAQTKYS